MLVSYHNSTRRHKAEDLYLTSFSTVELNDLGSTQQRVLYVKLCVVTYRQNENEHISLHVIEVIWSPSHQETDRTEEIAGYARVLRYT